MGGRQLLAQQHLLTHRPHLLGTEGVVDKAVAVAVVAAAAVAAAAADVAPHPTPRTVAKATKT